jgi:hypothetical protein
MSLYPVILYMQAFAKYIIVFTVLLSQIWAPCILKENCQFSTEQSDHAEKNLLVSFVN